MRIDAHQHFWRYSAEQYPWIGPGMERLARDFLPADLAPLLEAGGIAGTVAVQARQSLEETRWLLELADGHGFIRGVVGWVDLRSTHVADQLARFAGHPRFVGVRHVVQDEADPRFLLGEAFLHGLARVAEAGLVYDLLVLAPQLPAAAEMVALRPGQPFVLDHLAKPPIAAARLDPWRDDIRALARHPHVSCKLSGMVTEARLRQWRREDFLPYMETALEAFSPERLMFGSDWPVCTLSGEYAEVAGIVDDFLGRLAPAERAAIEGGTAARVYGLSD
ncbi:MAG: amidohydrolase family protein [Planctomycetaceae bacterium]